MLSCQDVALSYTLGGLSCYHIVEPYCISVQFVTEVSSFQNTIVTNSIKLFVIVSFLYPRFPFLNALCLLLHFYFSVTVFGTSAKWLAVQEEKGIKPGDISCLIISNHFIIVILVAVNLSTN